MVINVGIASNSLLQRRLTPLWRSLYDSFSVTEFITPGWRLCLLCVERFSSFDSNSAFESYLSLNDFDELGYRFRSLFLVLPVKTFQVAFWQLLVAWFFAVWLQRTWWFNNATIRPHFCDLISLSRFPCYSFLVSHGIICLSSHKCPRRHQERARSKMLLWQPNTGCIRV